jgi:hypothetical protein
MLLLTLLHLHVPEDRNLGVLFDSNLSLYGHFSSVTKYCLYNIGDLRRIRPIRDQTAARNIAMLLSIQNLTTVTIYFSIFQQINWIVLSLFLI